MTEAWFESGVVSRYVFVALLSVFATAGSVLFVRGFVFPHPLLSILAFVGLMPVLLPLNRVMMPYAKGFFRRYGLAVVAGIIFTLAVFSLTRYFVVVVLLLLHAASCVFLRFLKRHNIGFEFVMLITVLSGVAYGAKAGAFIGAVAMAMDYIFSARVSYFSIVTIPTYALVGILASAFSGADVLVLGVSLTVFYNLFTWVFILGFMGGHVDKCLRFGLSNLAFNFLVFSGFAPRLLSLMI